jgi:acetyl esterase/lipase
MTTKRLGALLAAIMAIGGCGAEELEETTGALATCAVPPSSGDLTGTTAAATCASTSYTKTTGLAYATGANHSLDLYVPKTGAGPFKTVIWVHGGGWKSGSKADAAQALRLVCRGYAVASIDYRLSSAGQFPVQAHDVKAAVRFLRANAAARNLDPNKFALFGSSAGGHLAAVAGLSDGVAALTDTTMGNATTSSKVQAIVDWYGPTDLSKMDSLLAAQGTCPPTNHGASSSPEGLLLGCAPADAACAAKVTAANPMTYVDASDPPTLIMHGTKDCVVPLAGSDALYQKLRTAGVCSTFKKVVDGEHGGPKWTTTEVQKQVADYLDAVLSAPPAPTPTTPTVNCAGTAFVHGDATAANGTTFTYTSTDEGVAYRLEGVLYAPAGPGPFPGVVINHGKQGMPSGYAAPLGKTMRGWGMVAIGPMLTHATTDTPANLPDGPEGASDANVARAHKARDLLSCLNVDMNKVAMHGHSMGGYATGQTLGKWPNDFRAGSHTAAGVSTGAAPTKPDVAALIRAPYSIHQGIGTTAAYTKQADDMKAVLDASGVVNELWKDYDYPYDPNFAGDRWHVKIALDPKMTDRVRTWYRAQGLIP